MTDMVMPGGLSGREVAAQFSLEHPEAAILYTSGYSVELFGEEMGLQEGLNYLPKPYLAKQLIDVAARACSQTGDPVPPNPAG
jgi:DNA-binding NtrC family response regulator